MMDRKLRSHPPLLALLAGAFLFFPNSREPQSATTEVCVACHGTRGLEKLRGGKPISLYIDRERFSGSVHGSLACELCHSDASGAPHSPTLKPVSCVTCHADASDAYGQGAHGPARGIPEAPGCTDCHGAIHELLPRSHLDSPIHASNVAKTCASCHARPELAKRLAIPLVRPVETYLQSVHARAVSAGRKAAVCTDCHGAHAIFPGRDARSPVARATIPETCGKCHREILTAYRGSVHGEALARGARDAPICTDCHGEHRILSPAEPKSPVFAANLPVETCGRCHGDARLSEKYGLPLDRVVSFQESYHGLALRTGRRTVANCASCHGVHDILPSSDPRSHVHPANLARTCGNCHPGAGITVRLGPVHILPTSASSGLIYWVRRIYLWLIVVLIGSMALHNIIDFLSKARRQKPSVMGGQPPAEKERMPRMVRWQHGLVMVSFPLLAYTGFALKYPESWWASPLLRWESEIALRGLLHRISAIVLLAALIWHLAHLALSPQFRKRLSGLKPAIRDLWDFLSLQRYNLGLMQERPRFEKFSYIEKAEYWAFVWGMVIMTITGAILWFENITLRYIPWLADLATTVHFYEAVLATLAVLVWHFYWVIFDPDVYPIDMSWWHGRSPATRAAERLLEERMEPLAETEASDEGDHHAP